MVLIGAENEVSTHGHAHVQIEKLVLLEDQWPVTVNTMSKVATAVEVQHPFVLARVGSANAVGAEVHVHADVRPHSPIRSIPSFIGEVTHASDESGMLGELSQLFVNVVKPSLCG